MKCVVSVFGDGPRLGGYYKSRSYVIDKPVLNEKNDRNIETKNRRVSLKKSRRR